MSNEQEMREALIEDLSFMLDAYTKNRPIPYSESYATAVKERLHRYQAATRAAEARIRELEAAVKALPRYSFLSPSEGGVRRYSDKSGAWLERHEVITALDAAITEHKDNHR